ncbi:DNA replication/repair protein RecF [Pseudocalidococcus azoricus]
MYLQHLSLRYFRNYVEQQVKFQAPKIILVGENAQGKSNLLEAVEWLAGLSSHRTGRDRDLIQTNQPQALIQAEMVRASGSLELGAILRQSGRRSLLVNGELVARSLDFLGHLNAVQFSSLDLDLVRGGPTERRAWLDRVLTQLEPIYAHLWQTYHQILRQRNALLKQILNQATDASQLPLWNQQLATAGVRLMRRRHRLIERLGPLAQAWQEKISDHRENLALNYGANVTAATQAPEDLWQAFMEKIQARTVTEQIQGTTLVGPHRDDVELLINDSPARQYGSQGQQRTLVLALKLAELELIEAVIGESPLLLLDDVLAELDLHRQNQLLGTIENRFQTIITTTHLGAFDPAWLSSAQVMTVKAGLVSPTPP